MIKKMCRTCGARKDLDNFYVDRKAKDGHRPYCSECELASRKAYYKTHDGQTARRRNNHKPLSKALRLRWEQSDAGKAIRKRYAQERYASEPEKKKAVVAVYRAIQQGKLPHTSTLPCKLCDEQAVNYHHHKGYARKDWLAVIPLCRTCHDQEHGIISPATGAT